MNQRKYLYNATQCGKRMRKRMFKRAWQKHSKWRHAFDSIYRFSSGQQICGCHQERSRVFSDARRFVENAFGRSNDKTEILINIISFYRMNQLKGLVVGPNWCNSLTVRFGPLKRDRVRPDNKSSVYLAYTNMRYASPVALLLFS